MRISLGVKTKNENKGPAMKQNNARVKKKWKNNTNFHFHKLNWCWYYSNGYIEMELRESHNSVLFDHMNGNYSVFNSKGDESVKYCHPDQINILEVTSIISLHFMSSHINTLSVYWVPTWNTTLSFPTFSKNDISSLSKQRGKTCPTPTKHNKCEQSTI